jgi:RHS repeat-associated protein
MTYDSHGNLLSVTNALSQTTTFQYDANGLLRFVTDPLGHISETRYDVNGNAIETIDALGHSSKAEYDAIGRMTKTIDPLLRTSLVEYDAGDRVTKTTNPSGIITLYGYDANSNRTTVTDALGRIWTTGYDAKNRVVSATDPLGRKNLVEYNVGDQLIKATSPGGRLMSYTYDIRGQRTSVKDPLNGVVNFTYDFHKNLTTLRDQRGNTTTWTYDELYRATGMRDPLGRASVIESYDANNNVKATIDRLGRRVLMDYDALDRAQTVTYADATVSYQYDAAGRTTRIDDSQSGFAQWNYDNANRMLSETTNNGVVSYGYNDVNQRTAMTALNRPAVNYGYDTAGRLSTITQGAEVFTYGYDSLSRRSSLQRPNGVNTSYAYDEVNRLKRLTHANSVGNIEDLQYSYNVNDEISAITSLNSPTILPLAKTAAPANAANRISQVGTANYQFDNHGQTTSKTDATGTTNYQWDARGRLTKATLPNGQSIDYSFDALGRRASRSYQGTTTDFVYDGQDAVVDKIGTNVTTDYLNGAGIDDKLRQSATSTGSLYFLQDHLGSTNALTSAGGGVVERQTYEAFGAHNPSALTRYTYTGREDDAATGLMYYRARWYDSQQGRFATEDPVREKGGLNFYTYASNSPTNRIDPSGLVDLGWGSPNGPSIPYSNNSANSTPKYNSMDKDKCKALQELLERERNVGTGMAALSSSNTNPFITDPLLKNLNSTNGDANIMTKYGELDLDWFTDINAGAAVFQNPLGSHTALNPHQTTIKAFAYPIAKPGWSIIRYFGGMKKDITHPLPFQDPGETTAYRLALTNKKYSDIFDEAWFQKNCGCK